MINELPNDKNAKSALKAPLGRKGLKGALAKSWSRPWDLKVAIKAIFA